MWQFIVFVFQSNSIKNFFDSAFHQFFILPAGSSKYEQQIFSYRAISKKLEILDAVLVLGKLNVNHLPFELPRLKLRGEVGLYDFFSLLFNFQASCATGRRVKVVGYVLPSTRFGVNLRGQRRHTKHE